MKRAILTYLFLVIVGLAYAVDQYKVTFKLIDEVNPQNDTVYITGDFNDWDYSAIEEYRLISLDSTEKSLTLNLEAGEYKYLFHRGSKDKVEMNYYGLDKSKRKFELKNDTVINRTVNAWKDNFPRIETLELSDSIINQNRFINLSNMNIWLYHEGNDSTWAMKDLDTSGWDKIRPADIKESFADKNGKTEGWFRAKIKVDSSFYNTPLNFYYEGWQAVDIFLDGKLIHSYGNTGANGKPFAESQRIHVRTIDLIVPVETENVLAIHFVDKLSKLPKRAFKGNFSVEISNNSMKANWDEHITQEPVYNMVRLVVGGLLSLLFWLLVFLNPGEKSLKIIAVFSTLLALLSFAIWMHHNPLATYDSIVINNFILRILIPFFLIFSILLFVIVFNRKVTRLLKIIFVFIFLEVLGEFFISLPDFLSYFVLLLTIGLILYYVISSRKTIKGAQWIIVIGFSLFIGVIIFAAVFFASKTPGNKTQSIFFTVLFLSFPLSLLVYIAWRYKEIITEVKQNASEVIRISEEKKELLASQNEMLEEQVKERTTELRQSLENLKSTQAQLLQSEKMASLGELTAGIAHEIQNPLNFVNNFSEVNKELIAEMKEEIENNNLDEVKALARDIDDNEGKIIFHGKRADAIVKSMLLHSRGSSGRKEPTDLNALSDEYLRLSYHGLRAKDKTFNADFKLEAAHDLPKVNVVPQDIGRVLINLINNAFYAVYDKNKQKEKDYKPLVIVTTKNLKSKIEISVKDNGNGIPDLIREKIFQPFFTTKPTGQGTGLGLSLSYDIIKAHGGELKLESEEGEGTTFIISLPVKHEKET